MYSLKNKLPAHIALFFTIFLISSCSYKIQPDLTNLYPPETAETVISDLRSRNTALVSYKGIGKLSMTRNKRPIRFRMAWSAIAPEKLRMVLLSSTGHPLETISSDGNFLYLMSHTGNHKFYKLKASESSLKRYLGIPIKTREIIDLLRGRIPVREHHKTILSKNPESKNPVVNLVSKWTGVVEKLYLDENLNVYMVDLMSSHNEVAYRAEFKRSKTVNGFRVPGELQLSTENGDTLHLSLERYWPNVEVSPDMFRLSEKG